MTYMTDSCDNLLSEEEDDYEPQLERHEEELDDDEEDALSALNNSSWGELDTAIARRPSASLSMNASSTTRSGTKVRKSSLLSNASLPDHSFTKDLSLNTCSTRDMSVSMIDASRSSSIGARSSFLDSMPDTTASSLLTTTTATTDWE